MTSSYLLGLGGTVDHEVVWDAAVLGALAAEHGVRRADADPDVEVRDLRDLVRSVLGFVATGRGGERFVADPAALTAFSARFRTHVTLGGTCVRAALALDRLGVPSTVHLVSIDDDVRRLLPVGVRHVCSASEDSTDPHVIVQIPAGARVRLPDGDVVATRSDRLIYVNDRPNRELVLDPGLGDLVAAADVVLVSGLNTVQDEATLDERLATVRRHLARRHPGTLVIFEDAGYHVPAHAARVVDGLRGAVDVHSMNEDELAHHAGRRVDLLDPGDVVTALHAVRERAAAPVVVVHTGAWAAAVGPGAERYVDALRTGVAAAGARYARGDALTAADLVAVAAGPVQPVGAALAAAVAGQGVHAVPAHAVDVATPTTIGLGDTFVGGFLAGTGGDAPLVAPAGAVGAAR